MDAIAMYRQDPFTLHIEKPLGRLFKIVLIPHIYPRDVQPLAVPIPPQMVAGEQISLVIQERHTAGCMTGHRDDLEVLGDRQGLASVNDPFGLGNGRETVELTVAHASSLMSARSARRSLSYGSSAPVKYAWRTKNASPS